MKKFGEQLASFQHPTFLPKVYSEYVVRVGFIPSDMGPNYVFVCLCSRISGVPCQRQVVSWKKDGQSFYWDLGSTLESRTALSLYLHKEVMKTFLETKEGSRSLEVFLVFSQEIQQFYLESAFVIQRHLSYDWVEQPAGRKLLTMCFIEKSVNSSERPVASNHITSVSSLSAHKGLRMLMKE